MKQLSFRPLHKDHAIAEQMIFFQFTPPITHLIPALMVLKDELKNEFPRSEAIKTVRFEFIDDKPSNQEIHDASGIVLSKPGPKNPQEWMINITEETISIHCTAYTRWDQVWENHSRYIKSVFSKFPISQVFMTSFGVKWLDQFIYEGIEDQYSADDLFDRRSNHIAPFAFGSGSRWHCHNGWFDGPVPGGFEVLNQLNVNSGQINLGGHLRTAVTIEHNQAIRADQRVDQLANLLPTSDEGFDALSGLMEILHSGNKQVLTGLLTASMCERIGLGARHRE